MTARYDAGWDRIVLAVVASEGILPSTLHLFVIDPNTWSVAKTEVFSHPKLYFLLLQGDWTYSPSSSSSTTSTTATSSVSRPVATRNPQLMIAASLTNMTQTLYSGVQIIATLAGGGGGGDNASNSNSNNVTASFEARAFTSELSVVESLGCFSGASSSSNINDDDDRSVIGLNVTLPIIGLTLSRWRVSDLQVLEPIGESHWTPLAQGSIWACKSPCVEEEQLCVVRR